MNTYLHFPAHRRRVTTPTDRILVRLLRAALSDDWSPELAVEELLRDADGNCLLLRRARSKLLRACNACPSEAGDRALTALAIALEESEFPPVDAGREPCIA